ncbi:MAG: sel1 repeat family protein [Proteobacteria bacterium]|nr:tetratricopeptide repeat protein [Alphaproteobacteria bacterium]NCC03434.1 sel1 repeat family protein [Pseudomonadota bacterium]
MRQISFPSKIVNLLAFMIITLMTISVPTCFADEPTFETLKKEAGSGMPYSQFLLGMAYVQGKGTKQDFEQAAQWLRKAADQGNMEAKFNLGVMYALGEGMNQDYKAAFEWYLKAAEQGHVEAQYNVGIMYYEGQGIRQDYKEAAKWLSRTIISMREKKK